jgi:muramoyltetrapeptide carboxypeptidase
MPNLKKPAKLEKGHKVVILGPAGYVPPAELTTGIDLLQSWGLEVNLGTTQSTEVYFAASDATRLAELQAALDDPSIKAIFAARGGYGMTRILDQLNFDLFKKHPKWIVGFSDITALHVAINHHGYQSIHGPMPRTFGSTNTPESVQSLQNILFDRTLFYQQNGQKNTRTGLLKAQLVGGNLCLLAHGVGSKYDIKTKNAILFIEDIGENPYKIDRMMVQLKRAGKLKDIVAVLIGHFTNCGAEEDFGISIVDIIKSHIPAGIPVSEGVPIGHERHNWAVPCGRIVTLDISETETIIIG